MMPVAPTPRKANSFSIESLMGGKGRSRTPSPARVPSPTSPEPAHTPKDHRDITGGVGSSFHPVTPGSGGLHGLKTPFGDNPLATLEGLNNLHRHLGVHGPHGLHPLHGALGAHMGQPHPGLPGMNPLLMGAHREMLPFYPWLMARHGNFLPHRFAGPEGFLLQPFRKPKRIRTAFSPSQLLRLEHAFEKNHYVVGQERKELAANLSLTETQVKVWFQNRRTKYKRMKAEEGEDGTCPSDLTPQQREEEDAEIDLESLDSDEEESHMRTMVSGAPMDTSSDTLLNSGHHLNRWRVDTQQV